MGHNRCMQTPAQSPLKKTDADYSAALPRLLIILSLATGLVDAVSVLGLGKVFTATMTGNIVFLGFAIAQVPGFSWSPYIVALALFALGAVAGGRLAATHSDGRLRRWLYTVAITEVVLLWLAAGASIGYGLVTPPPLPTMLAIIGLTAASMGLRNATVRALKVPDLTTTVLTMTVTGLGADSSLGGGANSNWRRRIAAICAILVGAIAGALLIKTVGLAVPLFVAGVLVLLTMPALNWKTA
jgi:uncharacterized membrane protein YoaK (UPF0700 family)